MRRSCGSLVCEAVCLGASRTWRSAPLRSRHGHAHAPCVDSLWQDWRRRCQAVTRSVVHYAESANGCQCAARAIELGTERGRTVPFAVVGEVCAWPGRFAVQEPVGAVAGAFYFRMSELSVVEAAGVEPASEKARNEENYVRSAIQQLQLPPQNRQEWRPPSPIDLGLMLRTEAFSLSRKMTLTHRRAGSAAGAAT